MQSCVLCQMEMWRGKSHAHTLSSIASPLFAVQSVSLFHSINRNAISIQCSFFLLHFDARFSVVLLIMRFTFAFSTHNQWHLGAFDAFLIPQVFVKRFSRRHDTDSFLRSIFFFVRFSCVCVCSVGCRWRQQRYAYALDAYSASSVRQFTELYYCYLFCANFQRYSYCFFAFFFRSFSFFRFRSQNQKRKREGRKKKETELRGTLKWMRAQRGSRSRIASKPVRHRMIYLPLKLNCLVCWLMAVFGHVSSPIHASGSRSLHTSLTFE